MKILKATVLLILSSIFLVACAADSEPDKSAEETIKEGVNNMVDIKSATYEISIDGTIKNHILYGKKIPKKSWYYKFFT